jgi:uncharacterized membrane protein
MDLYATLKWLHILSSTLLFGTGLGTAWYFWTAHRGGNARVIAAVGRQVVRADWLFTATAGVAQPVTGGLLVWHLGYDPLEPWLVASYALYGLAFLCWAPVVALQIRATRLAALAAEQGSPLPESYHRLLRIWFRLGWPAFAALLAIFWLMVAKPALW